MESALQKIFSTNNMNERCAAVYTVDSNNSRIGWEGCFERVRVCLSKQVKQIGI